MLFLLFQVTAKKSMSCISKMSDEAQSSIFDSCDIIKMREMKGEVGKKIPKKEIDNPSFL